MTSARAIAVWCIGILLLGVGCADKGEEKAGSKGAPLKGSHLEAVASDDREAADHIDPAAEPDAGADAGGEEGATKPPVKPSESDLDALVVRLKSREQAIALKERDVIHREQMVASLEESVFKQTEKLAQLKTQTAELLAKLGVDYKEERKAYEEKLKKEEEAREKENAAIQQASLKRTDEREQRIVQLTAAIKGMRASSGAGLLASMDEGDAVSVLRQLGARQAAELLSNLPADTAARLAGGMLGPKVPPPETPGSAGKESAPSGTLTASKAPDLPKKEGRE